ncbi:PhoX family protein [Psychrobacter aquaticus]|uniref:Putative phosphatase n=1 Tax=Psychrobacter aquaticus CMS 56 TaxID=1354303 RepID=U4TAD2_9GAMM|nr:PhoX family phosphatase [Psychrobacter aquaticus]ERL55448.1 putative phosphatase [Psychrobacter aquaticus CMS 56]
MTSLNDKLEHAHEIVEDSNPTNNIDFQTIISRRLNRRSILKGGTGLTAAAFFGALPLVGCSDDDDNSSSPIVENGNDAAIPAQGDLTRPETLNFTAVAHSTADTMTVAEGYKAEIILPLGTPLISGIEDWKDNREQSAESFEWRMGDNHDGMWFFGKKGNAYDAKASESGLLVMNHEYVNSEELSPFGYHVIEDADAAPLFQSRRLASDVRREVNCHGVAVVEMKRRADGKGYEMVPNSKYNRRVTSSTTAQLTGPVAGSDLVKTKFDPTGHQTRGINNNCGAGLSPWGTYLTTEENFLGVFARGQDASQLSAGQNYGRVRYGAKENTPGSRYLWHTPDAKDAIIADEFSRWDMTAVGANATEDYRNGFNTFGYITEIDPFDQNSISQKRTALGRFAHENCAYAPVEQGKPVVFYMGDDARGEYIYKFVSKAVWSNSDIGGGLKAGDKYLDEGTLYVAIFNEDGSGEWKAMVHGQNGLDASNSVLPFNGQDEVLVFARAAGDKVGATKMDRPEWISVSPMTGEVYITLTNNTNRGVRDDQPLSASNPRSYTVNGKRSGNENGHIIRWAEKGGDHAATSFEWDVYLFAAPHDLAVENLSQLSDSNDLSSPDGLYFDPRGVLWIQTDDGAYTDTTSCMLLAALPGKVSDGTTVTTSAGQQTRVGMPASNDNIKRFFVGPKGCEVTGIVLTPDFKTLFINIQHPDNWGAVAGGSIPRSATVMITKEDGGVILAESFDTESSAT